MICATEPILKGEKEVRHWTAEKDIGPDRHAPVALRVRQTPGQSWARLSVTSDTWEPLARAPILLDWETIAPLDRTPDEVLEALRSPPPAIPERIVEPAHAALWLGSDWARGGDAARLAAQEVAGNPRPFSAWAAALRIPRTDLAGNRYWHVSSDGDLPYDLPPEVVDGFRIALQRIEARLISSRPQNDNEPLIAATWCFAACPSSVKDKLVEAWSAHANGRRDHPILHAPRAITVVKQGAGRAVTGTERLRRLLDLIVNSALNTHDINALGMILSRRAEAPDAMTREMVDDLAPRLGDALLQLQAGENFQLKFRATILAIAGLFRWRLREPYALLAARDSAADGLRGAMVRVDEMLAQQRFQNVPALPTKRMIVQEIIKYLDGRGDPDILLKIEQS